MVLIFVEEVLVFACSFEAFKVFFIVCIHSKTNTIRNIIIPYLLEVKTRYFPPISMGSGGKLFVLHLGKRKPH